MHEKTSVRGVRWAAVVLGLLPALVGGIGCGSVAGAPQDVSTATKPATTSPIATQPTTAAAGRNDALAKRIDGIFNGTGATAAIRVIELPSRRELYAREADRPVMPASNMKLVTTAMALDHFGPTHGFETKLA